MSEKEVRQPRPETWSITELAKEFDVTTRTIRYYEDMGLLTPERRGTARTFHKRDRVRLALVLRGKRLGFTLEEILTTVNMYDESPGEAGQLRFFLGQIQGRREALQLRMRDIEQTLDELGGIEERALENLRSLEDPGAAPDGSE